MRKANHSIAVVVFVAVCMATAFSASISYTQVAAKTLYVCPMRCNNAVYEKPGSCPVCGMALVVKNDNPDSGDKSGYVCPPCGNTCDNVVHEKAGACPVCGMTLIAKGSATTAAAVNRPTLQQITARNKNVAIFIFDGVQIIDYAGPYEVFGQAGFKVFTVAEKPGAITTVMGMSVNPQFTFDNHPQPDILLIPGGSVPSHQDNPKVIQWIRENAKQAEAVLSVCNGAFFLAKAGLLDGLEATTFSSLIAGLQTAAPKARVVSNKRFADNGKIITSAGLSSGIDASLQVVEKLLGKGWAEYVATNLEYNWDSASKYVRAMLADKYLDNLYQFMAGYEREVLSHAGGVDHWENKWHVQTEASPAEVLEQLNSSLSTDKKWTRLDAGKGNGAIKSLWRFTGEDGKNWKGAASVQSVSGESDKLDVTVRIARSDAEVKWRIE